MNSLINTIKTECYDDKTTNIESTVYSFFKMFNIREILRKSNILKTKGASPLRILILIFNLPFIGKNFYEGIVRNPQAEIKKDAAYDFLSNPKYNWRRLCLLISVRIYFIFRSLLDSPQEEEVLIVDDSPADRSRSKCVELLARVYDHVTNKYIKGFRLLSLGWSDGNSFLGLDFALLSSNKKSNRYQEITKKTDKRNAGYKRRREATEKATTLIAPMVKRAMSYGIKAKYLLMDSWFSAPSLITELRKIITVICMVKDQPTWLYVYQGKKMRLSGLYGKLKKRRGRSKIKASVTVRNTAGELLKIVFVSCDRKRGWLALLSTDISLPDEEIIRLYGKRWDIEVFFKVDKQHLKLIKEIQTRDYDALIAHTTIVILRYNFLSWYQRISKDNRTCGSLFRQCCQEMENLKFIDALQRILTLTFQAIRKAGNINDETVQQIIDAVMGCAIQFFGLDGDKNKIISAC